MSSERPLLPGPKALPRPRGYTFEEVKAMWRRKLRVFLSEGTTQKKEQEPSPLVHALIISPRIERIEVTRIVNKGDKRALTALVTGLPEGKAKQRVFNIAIAYLGNQLAQGEIGPGVARKKVGFLAKLGSSEDFVYLRRALAFYHRRFGQSNPLIRSLSVTNLEKWGCPCLEAYTAGQLATLIRIACGRIFKLQGRPTFLEVEEAELSGQISFLEWLIDVVLERDNDAVPGEADFGLANETAVNLIGDREPENHTRTVETILLLAQEGSEAARAFVEHFPYEHGMQDLLRRDLGF